MERMSRFGSGLRERCRPLIFVALGLGACSKRAPEVAARAFFEEIGRGNFTAAYGQATFRFQAHQGDETFGRTVRELGLQEFAKAQWGDVKVRGSQADVEAVSQNTAGVRTRLRVGLLWERGAWRVASIRKSGPGFEGPEGDLFSSVGRGTGLNPFAGLQRPSEGELQDLVWGVLRRFDEALRSGGFESFHRESSRLWQEQVTPVTLVKIFEGMAGSGFAFSKVQGVRPLYDPAPFVDLSGQLIVQGYFPTLPLRLFFGMKFVPEETGWRLFGLDLTLR
jgi:hypothetical protein